MAGIVMALAWSRRERECVVAVFTERGIQPVGLKDCTLQQAVDKLKVKYFFFISCFYRFQST